MELLLHEVVLAFDPRMNLLNELRYEFLESRQVLINVKHNDLLVASFGLAASAQNQSFHQEIQRDKLAQLVMQLLLKEHIFIKVEIEKVVKEFSLECQVILGSLRCK